MEDRAYRYDVAFSFLAQDEALACQIRDLLQDRLQTFIFSERQREIAGTDGEITLSRVYGQDARVVVVLYRQGWGATPWTRVEETAIRNRAFDETYDFAIFIPLDQPPIVPQWLPRTRLWVGLNRWGPEGAAGVIEARAQERGGTPREESPEELAQRLSRQMAWKEQREQLLDSEEGVGLASSEAESLLQELQVLCDRITTEEGSKVRPALKRERRRCTLNCFRHNLYVEWHCPCVNALSGSRLTAILTELVPTPWSSREQTLSEMAFEFDVESDGRAGWRDSTAMRRLYTSKTLAVDLVKILITNGVSERQAPVLDDDDGGGWMRLD
jgi:hypothetical protein